MRCPFCGHDETKVVDSRVSESQDAIRRRRECLACERRFTTYERIDEVPYMVIKKDGRREKNIGNDALRHLVGSYVRRCLQIFRVRRGGFIVASLLGMTTSNQRPAPIKNPCDETAAR